MKMFFSMVLRITSVLPAGPERIILGKGCDYWGKNILMCLLDSL